MELVNLEEVTPNLPTIVPTIEPTIEPIEEPINDGLKHVAVFAQEFDEFNKSSYLTKHFQFEDSLADFSQVDLSIWTEDHLNTLDQYINGNYQLNFDSIERNPVVAIEPTIEPIDEPIEEPIVVPTQPV